MVRWTCNVKVKERVPSKELRERLGIDDIILILQQNRLQWYGHVLPKKKTLSEVQTQLKTVTERWSLRITFSICNHATKNDQCDFYY